MSPVPAAVVEAHELLRSAILVSELISEEDRRQNPVLSGLLNQTLEYVKSAADTLADLVPPAVDEPEEPTAAETATIIKAWDPWVPKVVRNA